MTWRRLTFVYGALVLVATLSPGDASHEGWIHPCLTCGSQGWADAVRNIVLFVPLGFTLRRGWSRSGGALLACMGLTISIEALQTVLPGRYSSVGDILFNALGAGAGIALAASVGVWLLPGKRVGLRLALAWIGAVALFVLALGWAVGPSPLTERPVGQWTPRPRGAEAYTGLLLAAHAGDHAIPAWYLPEPEAARDVWVSGGPIRLAFQVGTPPNGYAFLLRVVASSDELLSIGVSRDDLSVRMRSRIADLRLHDPAIPIPAVLAHEAAGDTVALSIWRESDRYCVERVRLVDGAGQGGVVTCAAALTLGSAWAALIPIRRLPAPAKWLVAGAWLAALAFPPGWWLGPLGGGIAGVGIAAWTVGVAAGSALGLSGLQLASIVLFGTMGGLTRRWVNRRRGHHRVQ